VITEHGGSARTRLELLAMLVTSGTFTDREAAMRHIDACVQGYQYWAGVDVMAKVRRFVGRSLAIVIGLAWAVLRWIFTPRRGPNPYEAFRTYFVTSAYSTSVYSLMFDTENVEKMLRAVDPIATFRRRVPYAVYLLTRNLLDYPRGEVGAVRRQATQILEILSHDNLTPMRDIDRRAFAGAAHYMLALVAVSEVDPKYTQVLDELAKVQMRFFDIGAENARAIFHRMRGEEEAALQIESRVEQMFVQLGSVWQMEAFLPIVASMAYAFARDTIGLRRSIDQLSRQILKGFRFRPFLELARGEYLREHGDLQEARAAIEASMKTDIGLVRIAALPALSETLLALGEIERACEVAFEGIKLGSDSEHGNIHGKLRSVRALALAEAALGCCPALCTKRALALRSPPTTGRSIGSTPSSASATSARRPIPFSSATPSVSGSTHVDGPLRRPRQARVIASPPHCVAHRKRAPSSARS
jgi:hypothetical protein